MSVDQLVDVASAVSSSDELARELVAFMARRFKRVAAFAVRQEKIAGWIAGPGVDAEPLARIKIPMGGSSLFSPVQASQDVYIGAIPRDPGSLADHLGLEYGPPASPADGLRMAHHDVAGDFYTAFGGPTPPAILLIPVVLRDRLVAVLYADNQSETLGPVDLALWKRLAHVASLALEILILKGKMRHL